ncbi:hypothetical protein BH09VER1_BH09VER1_45070 [soil metagenome]
MWKGLRSIFAVVNKDPAPVQAKHIGVDLADIDGAILEEDEMPRPQWKVIDEWIKANVPAEDLEQAWIEAAYSWLTILQKHVGDAYSVHHSKNFFVLTGRGHESARFLLRNSEQAANLLVKWLGPVAEKQGIGKHVLLSFATDEAYYKYIAYYYPSGHPMLPSSGVHLGGKGYRHIALAPSRQIMHVLVHELTHNRLAHLGIPRWLNEGLAMAMEKHISGHLSRDLDRSLYREHLLYWTGETIQNFWSGWAFHDPADRVSHLSYNLAQVLVCLLSDEFPDFIEFVSHAQYADAGEAAAQHHLGISLGDAVATFLGEGPWTPIFKEPVENN